VPVTPAFLADPVNTKVTLVKNELPIKDELKAMFPTMLAGGSKGMQQIEIRADEAGSPLKSEAPLRVSQLFYLWTTNEDLIFAFICFLSTHFIIALIV